MGVKIRAKLHPFPFHPKNANSEQNSLRFLILFVEALLIISPLISQKHQIREQYDSYRSLEFSLTSAMHFISHNKFGQKQITSVSR